MAIFTFEELRYKFDHKDYEGIPDECGIYIVSKPKDFELKIQKKYDGPDSDDAYFKYCNGNDRYSDKTLKQNLLNLKAAFEMDHTLYIGKAGFDDGRETKQTLRERVRQYVNFGYKQGKIHVGGRAIWKLKNNKKLEVELIPCAYPETRESLLINYYISYHGYRPFANIQIPGIKEQ